MDKWLMCVVALILGMLMANMLKNVCGCKTDVVEGLDTDVGVAKVGMDCQAWRRPELTVDCKSWDGTPLFSDTPYKAHDGACELSGGCFCDKEGILGDKNMCRLNTSLMQKHKNDAYPQCGILFNGRDACEVLTGSRDGLSTGTKRDPTTAKGQIDNSNECTSEQKKICEDSEAFQTKLDEWNAMSSP